MVQQAEQAVTLALAVKGTYHTISRTVWQKFYIVTITFLIGQLTAKEATASSHKAKVP